ncbi:hypothetical protein GE107_25410 [Cohnella sp. CFH 77786]|nr:hypothetical protein [Cohnella sp. CFH 77786]
MIVLEGRDRIGGRPEAKRRAIRNIGTAVEQAIFTVSGTVPGRG